MTFKDMDAFGSTTYVVLKTGGPRMKVRWHLGDTHVDTSWYLDGIEFNGIYHIDELEIHDDSRDIPE